MSTRPEILFPLFGDLTALEGVGPKTASQMVTLAIERPRDLIFTLPHSGIARRIVASVKDVLVPQALIVEITVGEHSPSKTKSGPYRINVKDAQTSFRLVFFHANADYLKKILPTGERRVVSGKVELYDGIPQMVHPDHILQPFQVDTIPKFEPVYPLTAGVTQKTMFKASKSALELVPQLPEWIDPAEKARSDWPDWHVAVAAAHDPKSLHNIQPNDLSRSRLAYDEFMAHQLTLALARQNLRKSKGVITNGDGHLRSKILSQLPYSCTEAQNRAVSEISSDMAKSIRMNRLLQGDVGSGKTLVAFLAILISVESKGQAVFMAPTEILARQHLESLRPLVDAVGVTMSILTGRDKGTERKQKLAALASGKTNILIGTHAVFQNDVVFLDLRLAIIDEQHRFGVRQRLELGQKGKAVDVLVMTATPIPRSMALAQYGDMDVSVLDEKPPGRKPIKTVMVTTQRLSEVIDHLRNAVEQGKQAFWVCPIIEESEVLDYTSAEDRFKSLRAAFGENVVDLVHGQMHTTEKDRAMARFEAGASKILVATTVIEVGVDIPNASIIVIERAEIFGLAQLHQLRGRVGRSSTQSTCLLLYQAPLSDSGRRRLGVLRDTEDGFVISQTDLDMRGSGDLIGTAQSGLPRFRIADLDSMPDLMAKAQSDARALLTRDPDLSTDRGKAARLLLWLMEQEKSIRFITVG